VPTADSRGFTRMMSSPIRVYPRLNLIGVFWRRFVGESGEYGSGGGQWLDKEWEDDNKRNDSSYLFAVVVPGVSGWS